MGDLEARRAANIAAKETARKEKNDAIKAQKQASAAAREEERNTKKAAEEEKSKKNAELQKKRDANIAEKERARDKPKKTTSKHSKSEVMKLKQIFDGYDHNGDGEISFKEFKDALIKEKQKSGASAGIRSTLEQRQAENKTSIVDVAESSFDQMDANGDGTVTFKEMLKLMFKNAREEELELMWTWVKPADEPEPEPEIGLSEEGKVEINKLFKSFDKEKKGYLTAADLKEQWLKTGIYDKQEIEDMLKEYDTDSDKQLSKEEFQQLMFSTGMYT